MSFQVNETNSNVTVDETVTTLVVEDKAARVTITGDGTEVEITAPGPQGAKGDTGPGVPAGGATGDLMVKDSATDYDTSWTDAITVDKLTFDVSADEDLTAPGEMAWDSDFGTFDTVLSNGDDLVTMHVGQDIYYRVKNASGVTLSKGTLVMATTPSGESGKISVVKAVADGSFPSQYIMGVVAEEIEADAEGFVVHFGRVRKLDTQTPNWYAGDILWADPAVPGGLTKVSPAAPNSRTIVAIVLSRQQSNGAIFVRPTYGSDLSEDERVTLTNITGGQALIYNGTVGVFENVSLSASNVSGVVPTTRQVGSGTGLAGGGDLSTDRTLSVLYGSTSGTAAAGDDARLSDARTPLAHATTHHTDGSDPLTATNIGAAEAATQVIAGTGLSGGGTLEADRTLTVLYGTTAGTAAQGDDARLSDARTPTAHASTHFTGGSDPISATNIGAAEATVQVIAGTGLSGGGTLEADRTLTVLYGTTAGTAAAGDDARLSDARTPTAHASTHFTGGSDPLTATNIGAAQATTQIIAGTGLSGGGTLEADRTLEVLYGTTSGTAASGDRGLITGGTTEQVLVKSSATDYDTEWQSFLGDLPLDPAYPNVAPGWRTSNAGTRAMVADRLWYFPYTVDEPLTIDGLTVQVTTAVASSELRLGLYAADTAWQPTGAPIVDAGVVDCSTTGYKTASFSAVTLSRGRYVGVMIADDTQTLRRHYGSITAAFGTASTITNTFTWSLYVDSQSSVFTNGFPDPPVAWDTAGVSTTPFELMLWLAVA